MADAKEIFMYMTGAKTPLSHAARTDYGYQKIHASAVNFFVLTLTLAEAFKILMKYPKRERESLNKNV